MTGKEIHADPARLRQIADAVGQCRRALRADLSSAQSQVSSLKGVWTGAGAEAFQASFHSLLQKCEESMDAVAKLGKALYDSADAYERNEKSVRQEAANIPKLPANSMR